MFDDGVCSTNGGKFTINIKAKAKDITLPQFTSKRKSNATKLSINPCKDQKYKAIFGMVFLFENKIDFINSKREISWQGINTSIDNLPNVPAQRLTHAKNKEEMKSNQYRP